MSAKMIDANSTPAAREIDSLRAQLSVARAQTASDREYIAELRMNLADAMAFIFQASEQGILNAEETAPMLDAYKVALHP